MRTIKSEVLGGGPSVPAPLTRSVLDQTGCGEPNCTHDHSKLFLHSRCHRGRPTLAMYDKASGTLVVTCVVCNSVVAKIAVAP